MVRVISKKHETLKMLSYFHIFLVKHRENYPFHLQRNKSCDLGNKHLSAGQERNESVKIRENATILFQCFNH